MKKLKKLCLGVFALFLAVSVSGCNSNSFDAQKYVKGILDSTYLGDMTAYMETVEVTEEEAQKSYEEGVDAEAALLLESYAIDDASDAMYKKMAETYKKIYKKAKYEVKEAKQEGTKYIVEVVIYPMDIYQKSYEEFDKEFDALLESDIEDDKFADTLAEKMIATLEKNIDSISYGEPETFSVELTMDKDGLWGMDKDTFYDMDEVIIDYK